MHSFSNILLERFDFIIFVLVIYAAFLKMIID